MKKQSKSKPDLEFEISMLRNDVTLLREQVEIIVEYLKSQPGFQDLWPVIAQDLAFRRQGMPEWNSVFGRR